MSIANKFVAFMSNTQLAAGQDAICDFDFTNPLPVSEQQATAQLLAYLGGQLTLMGAQYSTVNQVLLYRAGTHLGIPMTWPTTEFGAIHTEFPGLPGWTDYGEPTSDGDVNLLPIGTSMCVTERTAVGGPSGRGRHFLPFISSTVIDTDGKVGSGNLAQVKGNWDQFIMDSPPSTSCVDLTARVANAAGTTALLITSVRPQGILSNLRSRRR